MILSLFSRGAGAWSLPSLFRNGSAAPARILRLLGACACALVLACGGVAPGEARARAVRPSSACFASSVVDGKPFVWKGPIAKGLEVEVRSRNGSIEAEASTGQGDSVEVTAVAHASGHPAPVWIRVREHERGITITVVRGRTDAVSCVEASVEGSSSDAEQARVDVTVHLPASVRFSARTINGAVTARSLAAADVRTTNGNIVLISVLEARAHTVNGSIQASLVSTARSADFGTVNGNIDVTLPRNVDADIVAETLVGTVTSSFPLSGLWSSRRVRGTVGRGGRELRLKTVNGCIRIEPLA